MTALTPSLVAEGLEKLGTSQVSGRPALLGLTLRSKGLDDIGLLARHVHLQDVDLSDNAIQSAWPLAALPTLRTVDLSGNAITDWSAFASVHPENPRKHPEEVMGASTLQRLNLSANKLTAMPRQIQCRYLTDLNLDDNGIARLTGLAGLKFLTKLSLARNRLTSTVGLVGENLRELSLEGNRVSHLGPAVGKLAKLETLNLRGNLIVNVANLMHCVSLRDLDVSGNLLCGIRQVEYLAKLGNLIRLTMAENPVCDLASYRLRVVARLDQVFELDNERVSSEDKVKAQNVYGADVASRRATHDRFVGSKTHPGVPVVEFVNPFEVWTFNRTPPELLVWRTIELQGRAYTVEVWDEGEAWCVEHPENGVAASREGLLLRAFDNKTSENLVPLLIADEVVKGVPQTESLLDLVQMGTSGDDRMLVLADTA